jgi:hypothetical protein
MKNSVLLILFSGVLIKASELNLYYSSNEWYLHNNSFYTSNESRDSNFFSNESEGNQFLAKIHSMFAKKDSIFKYALETNNNSFFMLDKSPIFELLGNKLLSNQLLAKLHSNEEQSTNDFIKKFFELYTIENGKRALKNDHLNKLNDANLKLYNKTTNEEISTNTVVNREQLKDNKIREYEYSIMSPWELPKGGIKNNDI